MSPVGTSGSRNINGDSDGWSNNTWQAAKCRTLIIFRSATNVIVVINELGRFLIHLQQQGCYCIWLGLHVAGTPMSPAVAGNEWFRGQLHLRDKEGSKANVYYFRIGKWLWSEKGLLDFSRFFSQIPVLLAKRFLIINALFIVLRGYPGNINMAELILSSFSFYMSVILKFTGQVESKEVILIISS